MYCHRSSLIVSMATGCWEVMVISHFCEIRMVKKNVLEGLGLFIIILLDVIYFDPWTRPKLCKSKLTWKKTSMLLVLFTTTSFLQDDQRCSSRLAPGGLQSCYGVTEQGPNGNPMAAIVRVSSGFSEWDSASWERCRDKGAIFSLSDLEILNVQVFIFMDRSCYSRRFICNQQFH